MEMQEDNVQLFMEIMAELEQMVRMEFDNFRHPAGLHFRFHPNSIGPYGKEGSQWQAEFISKGAAITDYGRTIEEAARRLLDRLQHPENYPEPDYD
jgi:hypothetical protein